MLDIKLIRENPEKVKKGARDKGFDINIDHVLEIDTKYRELLASVQKLREERNRIARLQSPRGEASGGQARVASNAIDKKDIEQGKKIKNQLEKEEHALRAVEEELNTWLLKIPNLPSPDVNVGKSEKENLVIKTYHDVEKLSAKGLSSLTFDFTPRDHLAIGEQLNIIDVVRAAKVSGTRFAYLKNEGALLEFALIQFAFDTLVKEGFTPVIPPVLVKREVMKGLGYMEHGAEVDMFYIPSDGLFLAGTAEHPIVAMHKDEIFNGHDVPRRYVGFSSSFRREAGSYGLDTRGILRVHQFDKVEMVSFVTAEQDDQEHEYLLSLEEKLFQMLGIPYQVVKMCTGDLGFPVARKYDIEAWIPTQGKYREVTSTSTTTDFQARRLNIKYREGDKTEYAHILNGTAFAIGRTLVAILENYQQKDGSVMIPEVLRKYTGFDRIKPKSS